jgi:hypothetical protein
MSKRQKHRPVRGRGDYLGHLVALARAGRVPIVPGTVAVLGVLHDADCKRPEGGPCTCQAELGSLTYPRTAKEDAD